jgi:hypothetical protein
MTTPNTGGCLCGAVRYSFSAAPLFARTCWCRVCQYLAAGNATVNVGFPVAALTVTGELRDYESIADSGNRMHRRFCPTCGTPVFSASDARPTVVIVRAGTLDDPELGRPGGTIWTDSAPSWACIDSALPTTPRQPPPA